MKKVDRIGFKYGKLTVLERAESLKSGGQMRTRWRCLCDCGNTVTVESRALTAGNDIGCGCYHRKDETGKKYGKLRVLEKDSTTTKKGVSFLCQCDCGVEVHVLGKNLRAGLVKSCGRHGSENRPNRLDPGIAQQRKVITYLRSRSVLRGFENDLSDKRILDLIKAPCHYCGALSSNSARQPRCNGSFEYNGIDRVDNSLGYIEGNVVTACKFCNYAKRDRSTEDFIKWVDTVYNHLRR